MADPRNFAPAKISRYTVFGGTQDVDIYCNENQSDHEDEYIVERKIVTKSATVTLIGMK